MLVASPVWSAVQRSSQICRSGNPASSLGSIDSVVLSLLPVPHTCGQAGGKKDQRTRFWDWCGSRCLRNEEWRSVGDVGAIPFFIEVQNAKRFVWSSVESSSQICRPDIRSEPPATLRIGESIVPDEMQPSENVGMKRDFDF